MPANDEKTTREPEKKKNKMFKFFSLGCRGRSREESHERANKTVSTCDVVSLNGESKKKKKETSAKGSFSVTTLKETQSMNNLSRTSREMFCTKIVEQKPLDEARRDARATPIEDADEARADSEILSNYSTAAPFSEGGTGESFEVFAGFLPLNSENILETSVFEKDQSQPLARRKIAQILKEPGDSPVPSVTSEEDSFAEERLDSLNPDAEASYSFVRNFKERLSIGGSMRQIKRRRRLSWSTPERPLSATEIPTSLPPEVRLRKRVDSSRRDAVEAGFEPRDAVLRCHSTQSLRDAQAFNRSEFQASDLVSSNPSGRTSVSHTVLNSVAPSVSSSNSRIATKVRPTASRSSHDYNEVHQQYLIEEPQKRRSLQALNANSLYQMTSDRMANSEQWPQEEHIFNGQHHGICDSTTPTFPNDHRRSVQNDSRNSFFDGVRMTSTPKSRVAVAPQQQKPRYSSGSRDELHLRNPNERRNSGGANLSAVQSYMLRHGGEERLVDGPITTSEGARVAYLERKVRELEEMMSQQPQPSTSVLQLTPVTQARHARNAPPTQLIISNNGSTVAEQIRMQEMTEQLSSKEKKVAELEKKLLKAYTRIEKQQEEFDDKVRGVISDSERARDDLTRMVERMRQLEAEAEVLRSHSAYGDNANEQAYRELQDKIWKQDREIKDQRIQMEKLRGKEAEFEKMRSEMVYLEMQNEELNKTLEAKKTVVEELERNVNTMRLEQTLCQQSCSSGSTPLAEDSESMADVIRPSLTRPYTKAHSTLGSNMSPLPHAKSSGLTKSFSNFAIDVTKRDDITAAMSRSIRTQQRQITLSRLMVRCLRDTVEKLARGENPDVCRLLGIKTDSMSESEFEGEQTAEESKPFSMMAAEKALHKQERGLKELDSDLEAIRQSVAVWYESTLERNGQGDEACRVQ